MSDQPKDALTDTGRQRAVEDAAERGARRYFEGNTPPTGQRHGDSSDTYEIAERVVDRKEPAHILYCENDPAGPVCKVTRRIETMEARISQNTDTVSPVWVDSVRVFAKTWQ
jgi:hypothetical protein